MNKTEFYKIYLPALRKALEEDHINLGFCVRSPEYFIVENVLPGIVRLIDTEWSDDAFIIEVDEYFDAVSHYAEDYKGIPIYMAKENIIRQMQQIAVDLKIAWQ
ncbi:hypothetical protein LX64_01613 [Chitinophaga skermanii]|uniref:Uncharacterized protein n=1 Tax=Chitinophaga skermanii TaxID=331697 RepID=A0A327QPC6_9BACT|nr:hypothetical protein [Chitinophaga skermanii]RAJ06486.1 hypothetical protein LX64_01613 [Chitinophaga skermanii]